VAVDGYAGLISTALAVLANPGANDPPVPFIETMIAETPQWSNCLF